jgi:protoheme IX farnesyltransferase
LVALGGIALSAGGALSLNQWWERKTDALMRRTAERPLPRGDISPAGALVWSLALGIGGVAWLACATTLLAAALATATIVIYGLIYTPLKRRTRWATEIGSLSGALPPLLGAAAAGDAMAPSAWVLAVVILLWQMPHFFAIGWMYRDDYRAAGFPLLPAVDSNGTRTAAWSLAYSLVLASASLAPWVLGWVGPVYGVVSTIGAATMVWTSWRFLVRRDQRDREGRRLFFTTILYLPPVMAALVIDRW